MAYISKSQATRRTFDITKRSQQFDLSGSSTTEYLHTAENDLSIRLIRAIYEETTSADAGVGIRIGKMNFPDYFASFTSAISTSRGVISTVIKFDNRQFLLADETLIVECDGGKTGAGAVSIQIEMEGYR